MPSCLSHLPPPFGSSVLTDGEKREEKDERRPAGFILLKPAQLPSSPPSPGPGTCSEARQRAAAGADQMRRPGKKTARGRTHAWKNSGRDVGSLALATRTRRISKQSLFTSRLTANGVLDRGGCCRVTRHTLILRHVGCLSDAHSSSEAQVTIPGRGCGVPRVRGLISACQRRRLRGRRTSFLQTGTGSTPR